MEHPKIIQPAHNSERAKTETKLEPSQLSVPDKNSKHVDLIFDSLLGKTLAGKYRVEEFLDQGSNG